MGSEGLQHHVTVCLFPEDGRQLEMRVISHDGKTVDWVELHGNRDGDGARIVLADIQAAVHALLSGDHEIMKMLAEARSDTESAQATRMRREHFNAQREALFGLRKTRGMKPSL